MSARRIAPLLVLGAALHALSFLDTGPVDDDFIIHRYAREWLRGNGLAFGAGAERVEGFTAPLWVLLSALGQWLRVPVELWSVGLGVLANVGIVVALIRAWRELVGEHSFPVPALLVAASPAIAWHGVAGLGTTTLALFVTLWFTSAARATRQGRSLVPAAICLGLAGLVRAEAVLFALPWAAFELARRRSWTPLLAFVPAAAWTVFRWSYYGRFLPITYDVKKLTPAQDLAYGADYLVYSTAQTGVALWLALAVVAAMRAKGAHRDLVRAAALGLAAHTAYVVWVGGDYLELARFHVPALPLLVLVGCLGARALWPARQRLLVALSVTAVLAQQWPQTLRSHLLDEGDQHFARWRALGVHFGATAEPGTTVALSPIGLFGYYSDLPIIDVLGVTNTAIARADPDPLIAFKGHHRHDGAWVVEQRPDVVILGNGVWTETPDGVPYPSHLPWERSIWEDPAFQRDWTPMWVEIPGSDLLLFYLHRDATPPVGAQPL